MTALIEEDGFEHEAAALGMLVGPSIICSTRSNVESFAQPQTSRPRLGIWSSALTGSGLSGGIVGASTSAIGDWRCCIRLIHSSLV